MREWQVKRRERTRQLIELGGLVVKAGLVELTCSPDCYQSEVESGSFMMVS